MKSIDWFEVIIISLAVVIIASAVFVSVLNESHRITNGIIVDKDFKPAYADYSNGKYIFREAHYSILLQGNKDGESVLYWKNVPYQEYEKYKIGDVYP